jgi:heat shock protein HtpX
VIIAVILAIVLSLGSYFYGDRAVLASTHAHKVTPEQEPRLHNIVDGLAIAAGVPKPDVYVVPELAPNAFATGRDPQHSSIAVTQGLLDTMNRVELEGVIGHEMSHILDRDILIGTVVATVVGAAVLMSQIFMRSWFWGGGRGRRDSNSGGEGAGALTLILFAVGIVLLILAPLAGQLIKLSVSRNREYLADAEGVALTVSAGPDLGAPEDLDGAARDACRQQRDRAPVARSALAGPGLGHERDGEAVLDAPADPGSDQAPPGDVAAAADCFRAGHRRYTG